MLIRFNIANFLSFNKMQEFSMISGKVRNKADHIMDDKKLKLLKFAAIYGANASGKSNLITAMDFARTTILSGLPEGHTNKYYRNIEDNKNKPSYFEFEIKLNNKYYAYGFEVVLSKSHISSEWLFELGTDGHDKKIFTRDVENGTFELEGYFKNNDSLDRLNIYAEDIRNDDSTLFLTVMNTNKADLYIKNKDLIVLNNVYKWIANQLDINYPDRPMSDYSYFMTEKDTDEIYNIISSLGTGISKFNIIDTKSDNIPVTVPKSLLKTISAKLEKEISETKKTGIKTSSVRAMLRSNKELFIFEIDSNGNSSIKTVQFEHINSNALFSLSEESDGTRRLLDLIEILLATNNNKIYVIDEIDRCLHPQLTYKLIELYFNMTRESNRQLIVTSHESTLLDFDLLRRDEIWFVDKDSKGESSIYSLEAYNTRFDQKVDKAYLDGRYGGVPIFNSVFPLKEE